MRALSCTPLVLAAEAAPRTEQRRWLLQCVRELWGGFRRRFVELWDTHSTAGDACSAALFNGDSKEASSALDKASLQHCQLQCALRSMLHHARDLLSIRRWMCAAKAWAKPCIPHQGLAAYIKAIRCPPPASHRCTPACNSGASCRRAWKHSNPSHCCSPCPPAFCFAGRCSAGGGAAAVPGRAVGRLPGLHGRGDGAAHRGHRPRG